MTDHEKDLVKVIQKLRQGKKNRLKLVSNWEVDDYYERKLKKYDTE